MTTAEAFDLARGHHEGGRLSEAESFYRQILAQDPRHSDALHLLGVIAHQVGQHAPAVELIRGAIAIEPGVADYHNNLSLALQRLARLDEAEVGLREALRLNPSYPEAYNNLGNVERSRGRLDEAVAAYAAAIRLRPDYADAFCNLGTALKDRGELEAAVTAYRSALQLRPNFPKAHSHLIFTLHYLPQTDARLLAEELHRWRARYADPLRSSISPHPNDRNPQRRLRVGYVSPDLHQHAVGRFLLPILARHDHDQFEIFVYSDVSTPDDHTTLLRSKVDVWRDTVALDDDALARQVRADQIDVLIDLSLHTGRNRLLTFARKPAPVQATYLAYCGSSGLTTIDYRITDPILDPPGSDRSAYSEKSLSLPGTYWCYQPSAVAPAVASPPADTAGYVTLGCLNNFCKITEPTFAAWSRILNAVPTSRILIHANQGSHRPRTLERFGQTGIASSRVSFLDFLPLPDYFAAYGQIDLALDPFPFGGGTTTCDSLWMGVPVVAFAGQLAMSRAAASVLHHAGLAELVAHSVDDYVDGAVALARNPARLAQLRNAMRARLLSSPLLDAPRLVANLETAYREMWRQWCAQTR